VHACRAHTAIDSLAWTCPLSARKCTLSARTSRAHTCTCSTHTVIRTRAVCTCSHTGIARMHIHMHTHAVKPFCTCIPWHCMNTHTHTQHPLTFIRRHMRALYMNMYSAHMLTHLHTHAVCAQLDTHTQPHTRTQVVHTRALHTRTHASAHTLLLCTCSAYMRHTHACTRIYGCARHAYVTHHHPVTVQGLVTRRLLFTHLTLVAGARQGQQQLWSNSSNPRQLWSQARSLTSPD